MPNNERTIERQQEEKAEHVLCTSATLFIEKETKGMR